MKKTWEVLNKVVSIPTRQTNKELLVQKNSLYLTNQFKTFKNQIRDLKKEKQRFEFSS